MIMAASKALAGLSPTLNDKDAPLLPPVADCRKVSVVVAKAVALAAMAGGIAATIDEVDLDERIHAYVWEPVYLPYERIV
jgi:malate dehydrogenase (oxaloacetate-decarboxylating)